MSIYELSRNLKHNFIQLSTYTNVAILSRSISDWGKKCSGLCINNSEELSCSNCPEFSKFESNTVSDWLNHLILPIKSFVTKLYRNTLTSNFILKNIPCHIPQDFLHLKETHFLIGLTI